MNPLLILALLFVAQASSLQSFDLGEGEIAEGWIGVPADLIYNQDIGYGWTHAVRGAVREIANSTNQVFNDIVWSGDINTFIVDVPDGLYEVSIHYGDTYVHAMYVECEGIRTPLLENAVGEYLTEIFTVAVRDGQVEITFDDKEGYNWAIGGIEIEYLSGVADYNGYNETILVTEINTVVETIIVTESDVTPDIVITESVTTTIDYTETVSEQIFGLDDKVVYIGAILVVLLISLVTFIAMRRKS